MLVQDRNSALRALRWDDDGGGLHHRSQSCRVHPFALGPVEPFPSAGPGPSTATDVLAHLTARRRLFFSTARPNGGLPVFALARIGLSTSRFQVSWSLESAGRCAAGKASRRVRLPYNGSDDRH